MKEYDNQVVLAELIAREAHAKQLRKFKTNATGQPYPYIVHPEAVANMVIYPELKVVAWLHDVLEDCPQWTAARLIGRGISPDLVKVVQILTRRKDESYYKYIMRIADNKMASTIKIADLIHNLSDLPPEMKDLRDKYLLASSLLTYIRQQTSAN